MEERENNIMLAATSKLNCGKTSDLYIPVKMSEYRQLVRECTDIAAQLKIAEKEASHYCSELYDKRRRIDELTAEVKELKKRLEDKEAAE